MTPSRAPVQGGRAACARSIEKNSKRAREQAPDHDASGKGEVSVRRFDATFGHVSLGGSADEAEYRRRLESFFLHTLMSVLGYDAEICGLPPTATQDKKGFRFYASSGEAQQAFMEAEQISRAEFGLIFSSVDSVHAYT